MSPNNELLDQLEFMYKFCILYIMYSIYLFMLHLKLFTAFLFMIASLFLLAKHTDQKTTEKEVRHPDGHSQS